jgi:hypothetical protein
MDPISGTANVIAIVSLVIQVCDSIKKLNDFRRSVKNAPQDITRLGDELLVLQNILQATSQKLQLETGLKNPKIGRSHRLYAPLKICENVESDLAALLRSFEARRFKAGNTNIWASLVTSWKKERIKEVENQLLLALVMLQASIDCSSWQFQYVTSALLKLCG